MKPVQRLLLAWSAGIALLLLLRWVLVPEPLCESFTERWPGETLLPGFVSCASQAEALAVVGPDVVWRVIEDSPGPKDGRPPFDIRVVQADSVACLGQRGRLQLSFFNDRLEEAAFFADDPEALLANLRSQGVFLDADGRFERGNLAIDFGTTPRGRAVVCRDLRLWRQQQRWIGKYS